MATSTVPVMPTTRTPTEDPRDLLTISHVVTESIIVGCVILLSLLVIVILCMRNRLYHNLFNQFLCSVALATLIFSLFVRPGTIHEEIRDARLSQGYCGLYLVLLDIEWIVLPYTLLLMTIERVLAIRHPQSYADKMIKPARVALVAAPWVFGIFFGIIKNFAMNEDIQDNAANDHPRPNHLAQVGCYVVAEKDIRNLQIMLGEVIGNILPIMVITLTAVILVVSFCRRRQGSVQTDLAVPYVHSSSVLLVVIADIAMVIVLIDDAAKITRLGPWVVTHWLFSAVEILALILAITLLPDVRSATSRLCCCYDVRDEYRTLVNVNTSTQTSSTNSNNNE